MIPTQERITIPLKDGEAVTVTVEQMVGAGAYFERYNVPTVLHPRVLAGMADYLNAEVDRNPFDPRITSARDRVTTREQMSVEQICAKQMKELHRLEGWWAKNGDGKLPGSSPGRTARPGLGAGRVRALARSNSPSRFSSSGIRSPATAKPTICRSRGA